MFKDISFEEAINIKDRIILDVRSPGEYATATVPGAINIPLLDNVERSLVGKTYKQKGAQEAKNLAMTIVSPKLPYIVDSVRQLSQGKPIVLFCWRGGDRSLFMANILSFMGLQVYRVVGGFKAHRSHVREYLERESLPLKAIVLHGLTGVGKTEILEVLAENNMPVLDLEGLSSHRGSVFGKIGMPPSPSQKMFEALIVEEFKKVRGFGVFLVECESRRLGNLMVPQSVMSCMKEGYSVLLYAPIKKRVARIKEIYVTQGRNGIIKLQNSVERLTKYIGLQKVEELKEGIQTGHLEEVIEYLLINYYDPLYGYPDKPSNEYDMSLNTKNIPETVENIISFVYRLPELSKSSCRGGVPDGNWNDSAKCPGESRDIVGSCGATN
ncbi:MAG: tRNA 2-selenouridine(34) synthase MnmH [Firmicutes bacterium]|nr:tRNA 2-selenouridine(34) synthase MnmH [Bacillota bacterium]